jgi:hypothetical protein
MATVERHPGLYFSAGCRGLDWHIPPTKETKDEDLAKSTYNAG